MRWQVEIVLLTILWLDASNLSQASPGEVRTASLTRQQQQHMQKLIDQVTENTDSKELTEVLREQKADPMMRKLLKEEDTRRQKTLIAKELASIGPTVIPSLITALEGSNMDVAELSRNALALLGQTAEDQLIKDVQSDSVNTGKIQPYFPGLMSPHSVPRLIQLYHEKSSDKRMMALNALECVWVRFGDARAGDAIFQAIRNEPDTNVSWPCLRTLMDDIPKLSNAKMQRFANFAIDILSNGSQKSETVRYELTKELTRFEATPRVVMTGIKYGLRDSSMRIRLSSTDAARHIGFAAAPFLNDIAKNITEPALTIASIQALGSMGPAAAPAVPTLLNLAATTTPTQAGVRLSLAQTFALIGEPASQAVPLLIKWLDEPNVTVKRGALQALGQMGRSAESATQEIENAERNPVLSKYARDALKKIRG